MFLTKGLRSKLSKIRIVVFDFDGVMTDNRALLSETGEEYVFVSRADGVGIHMLEALGCQVIFLSSETKPLVARRAEKLNIPVIHGVKEKVVVLTDYIQKSGISPSELMYVGNEINDLECLKLAGVAVVPRDAHSCVQKVATVRLKTRGGYGVSRELAEILSRVRG